MKSGENNISTTTINIVIATIERADAYVRARPVSTR